MPELIEQMYTSQQIVIPPKFPYILKKYCKAAIKTQPYDLLRWSYEYFSALSQNRPPPVKLRLEYPIFTTEGGLTRGCLKVIANQLAESKDIPLPTVRNAWRGFCLDPQELNRIFCLCEVYMRHDAVPFLHFIAVAAGLLTKTLTHTMILVCDTLTKEPDGGSSAIPMDQFLDMYKFLAKVDASCDVKYCNGFREGDTPTPEPIVEEEQISSSEERNESEPPDDYWQDEEVQTLELTNDVIYYTARLSLKLNMPVIGTIQRSPSAERAGQIERENYLRERKGRAEASEEVDKKLKELSAEKVPLANEELPKSESKEEIGEEYNAQVTEPTGSLASHAQVQEQVETESADIIKAFVEQCYKSREERREDLERTFEEIAEIVERFKSANYDLGMVAGRQMSTTSGEFVVANIEKEIMDYVNEQIAILPDPSLKRKKAKPEEVAMIRDILDNFLDENMDVIVPEEEEVEEEEEAIPDIIQVYAVPGVGGPVGDDIVTEFENYALEVCKVQQDLFMPRNIRHFLCPPLEKLEEPAYESDQPKKEEVATGGVITD